MTDKMREAVLQILHSYKKEMESYEYYRSNPGVSVDDFDDIANEIVAWQSAQSVPVAQECDHLWMTGPMVKGGHPVEGPFVAVCSKCGAAPSLSNDDPLAAELERLRKDAERWRVVKQYGYAMEEAIDAAIAAEGEK